MEEFLEKMSSQAKEKYLEIFNPTFAMYIGLFVELVLLVLDLYTAFNSNMNLKQVLEVIIKRICAAMASVPGFQISYCLGGILPLCFVSYAFFPTCGALIAGSIGDFLLKLIGGLLVDFIVFLWERFTGFLGERLVPLLKELPSKHSHSLGSRDEGLEKEKFGTGEAKNGRSLKNRARARGKASTRKVGETG